MVEADGAKSRKSLARTLFLVFGGKTIGMYPLLPASINTNRTSTATGSSRGGHGAAHGDVYGQMEPIFIDSATGVVQRLMSCAPNT